jgi:hypothetical protein
MGDDATIEPALPEATVKRIVASASVLTRSAEFSTRYCGVDGRLLRMRISVDGARSLLSAAVRPALVTQSNRFGSVEDGKFLPAPDYLCWRKAGRSQVRQLRR